MKAALAIIGVALTALTVWQLDAIARMLRGKAAYPSLGGEARRRAEQFITERGTLPRIEPKVRRREPHASGRQIV